VVDTTGGYNHEDHSHGNLMFCRR